MPKAKTMLIRDISMLKVWVHIENESVPIPKERRTRQERINCAVASVMASIKDTFSTNSLSFLDITGKGLPLQIAITVAFI